MFDDQSNIWHQLEHVLHHIFVLTATVDASDGNKIIKRKCLIIASLTLLIYKYMTVSQYKFLSHGIACTGIAQSIISY